MPDLFKKAQIWLHREQTRHLSQTLTYCRGDASVAICATIGRTNHELVDTSGLLTNVQSQDYLILADDLELDGEIVEPRAGDQIIEGDLSEGGRVYELMNPAGGTVWRWCDNYQTRRRVFTKFIGTTPLGV